MSSLEKPTKSCPACETRVLAEAAVCDICGHVFGAWQPGPTASETPGQPPMPEAAAESATTLTASSPEPQPARPELTALKSADASGLVAIPGRPAWLIGLAISSVVLLFSLAVMVLRPQLGALATALPPTSLPPTIAPPSTAEPPTALPLTASPSTAEASTALPLSIAEPPTAIPLAAPPPTTASPTAVAGRVIGAVPSVALRSGAGTQFAVLRQLPPGQSVMMECQISGSVPAAFAPDGSDKWVRAIVDGLSGYIYGALLETGGPLIDCSTTQ